VDMLPFRRLERLAIGDRRLVLDVDDAIWLDTTPDAAGHRLAFLKDSARKVSWLAGEAAVVIAGNELLADWLSARSAVVTVVPSLVDPRTTPVRRHAERERVVWGWIGSPSSAAHLQARAEWIGEAARSLDRSPRLLVVGAKAPQIAGVEIDERPWTEDNERHALESMDIGLMPLHDSAWTRGKCAYKALQYMNAGIPVVSDDVGVSAATVGHEQGGLVTSDRTGWIEALRELSLDATLRARLGATARERVESGFSITGWAPKLASLLRGDLP
jgi:glycosyltransferase involved in cell wall biosynthesis